MQLKKTLFFSCEYCKIFRNTFFYRTPPVAASDKIRTKPVTQLHKINGKKCTLQFLDVEICGQLLYLCPWQKTLFPYVLWRKKMLRNLTVCKRNLEKFYTYDSWFSDLLQHFIPAIFNFFEIQVCFPLIFFLKDLFLNSLKY